MRKKFTALALAGLMAIGSVMPAYALDLKQYYNVDSTEIKTGYDPEFNHNYRFAAGNKTKVPGWFWIDGYCYYFTNKNMREKLTNTTTPDGYTVDDQGRWTVDGVAQYNGYGNLSVGTDELYAGKNDSERWLAMRTYLESLLVKQQYRTGTVAFVSYDDFIQVAWPDSAKTISHYSDANSDYLTLSAFNEWNDSPEYYVSYMDEIMELTLKTMCGDHAGQELFNDLRKAAEPAEGGPINDIIYDENGNTIDYIDPETGFTKVQSRRVETSGDGINFNYIDMNKWGSGQMKTDYGKSIILEVRDEINEDKISQTPVKWVLHIK